MRQAVRDSCGPDSHFRPRATTVELGAGARVEGARDNLGWRVAAIGRHASNLHTPPGSSDNTAFGAFNGERRRDGAGRQAARSRLA